MALGRVLLQGPKRVLYVRGTPVGFRPLRGRHRRIGHRITPPQNYPSTLTPHTPTPKRKNA